MASKIYEPPTKYRISTITATGSINANMNFEINLGVLYDLISVTESKDIDDDGVKYVEYGIHKTDTKYKGFSKKYLINRRKDAQNKRFDNQLTVIYKMEESKLNVKIFKNGNIQITGVKRIEQVSKMIEVIAIFIRKIYETVTKNIILVKLNKENEPITDEDFSIDNIYMHNDKIALINSDFVVGFQIKRDNLFKLIQEEYGMKVSYEPVIYPGAKLCYYWNSSNDKKNGICYCSTPCVEGKSSGHGDCNCKKVTIACFQSGKIIITGGNTIEQVDDAYECINKILYDNVDIIEQNPVKEIKIVETSTKKVVIDQSKIIYP